MYAVGIKDNHPASVVVQHLYLQLIGHDRYFDIFTINA